MTALLLCPGRGSYAKSELGWLSEQLEDGDEEVRELVARLEGKTPQERTLL